ncbi:MAG: queuosine precursor transporter [Rhodobacteraceae bacterium]|nr:queuosine precursor transporter [Paracoccaceae bacterium]
MQRGFIPGVTAMAAVVVASNILVQFLVGEWLTWGAFTYPVAFFVTDVMNRLYGAAAARRVVLVGFVVGVFCSLIGTQVTISIGPDTSAPAVTLRIALGSGLAFLVAQLVNVLIFDRLRRESWWRAPIVSSVIGSSIDTALFFTIAFSAVLVGSLGADDNTWFFNERIATPFGPEVIRWVGAAFMDWLVKLAIALCALIPFRLIVNRASRIPAVSPASSGQPIV